MSQIIENEIEKLAQGHEESLGTRILQVTPEAIQECATLLQKGRLVGMPTETVYGLGANALDVDACMSIFTAKGRPLTDPLIVHVHSVEQAMGLIDQKQENAEMVLTIFQELAQAYWPGPLTIVVKANLDVIPSLITAETGFVGIRMPNSPIALELLKAADVPVAAPSANKFGHVSPSKAQHVYDDFHKDSEVTILDGGSCSFGIESTVMKIEDLQIEQDPTASDEFKQGANLLILRRGGVSAQSLQQHIDETESLQMFKITISAKKHSEFKKETEKLEGPGQFLRHYAPNIDTFLYRGAFQNPEQVQLQLDTCIIIDFAGQLLHLREQVKDYVDMSASGSFFEAINQLYEVLRWAETRQDAQAVLMTDIIHFSSTGALGQDKEGDEHKEALFDRIYRATTGRLI